MFELLDKKTGNKLRFNMSFGYYDVYSGFTHKAGIYVFRTTDERAKKYKITVPRL